MGAGHAPGSALTGVTLAFTIMAGMATIVRLYTRIAIVDTAGVDDIAIVVAMVLSAVMTATMITQVNYGLGEHFDDLTRENQVHVMKWLWASIWVYYLALGVVKCSILLQYLRIFPNIGFRRACHAMIAVIAIYTCWTFFSSLLACVPIASFWDNTVSGQCLARLPVWFTNAGINIVTDIATAALPIPVLKSLQLPKRQKVALMAVFGLGGVTCIVSILRLQSLYAVSIAKDVSYENPMAAIWSNLEVNVGILCSCIPTMKGCINRYFPRLFKDRTRPSAAELPESLALTPGRGGTHFAMASRNHDDQQMSKTVQEKAYGDDSGIQVVTIMEQQFEDQREEEDHSAGESESMRNIIPRQSHSAI